MPRNYARIVATIWTNPDWLELSLGEQWLYFVLLSQPDINSAGVLRLTPRWWASLSVDADLTLVTQSMKSLAERRFVIFDEETEELLVRKFIKWDGGYTNHKRLQVIGDAARMTRSPALRAALATELTMLGLGGDSASDSASDTASDSASDALSRSASHGLSDALSDVLSVSDRKRDSGFRLQDTRARATRIDPKWRPSEGDIRWQRTKEIPDALAKRELEKFINYWTARAGDAGTKLDWSATWKNWLLNAAERTPTAPNARVAPAQDWMSITPKVTR